MTLVIRLVLLREIGDLMLTDLGEPGVRDPGKNQ